MIQTNIIRFICLMVVLFSFNSYSFDFKELKNVKNYPFYDNKLNNSLSGCMFEISINSDSKIFNSKENAVVTGSIKNLCNEAINLKDLGFLSLHLSKLDKDKQTKLTKGDTYSATFSLIDNMVNDENPNKTILETGESVDFRVKLQSLSWTDALSSGYPLLSRQNISIIPLGKYNFFLSLSQFDGESSDKYKRIKKTSSNQILITVEL